MSSARRDKTTDEIAAREALLEFKRFHAQPLEPMIDRFLKGDLGYHALELRLMPEKKQDLTVLAEQAKKLEAKRESKLPLSNVELLLLSLHFYHTKQFPFYLAVLEEAYKGGDAEAASWLGDSYCLGLSQRWGVRPLKEEKREENEKKALYYFQEAAKKNNAFGLYGVGHITEYTWGPHPRDEKQKLAVVYYQQAENLGSSTAMERLSCLRLLGIGLAQNSDMAFECLEKAVRMGNPRALSLLGDINDCGYHKNIPLAAKYYRYAYQYRQNGDHGLRDLLKYYPKAKTAIVYHMGLALGTKNTPARKAFNALASDNRDRFVELMYDAGDSLEDVSELLSWMNRRTISNLFNKQENSLVQTVLFIRVTLILPHDLAKIILAYVFESDRTFLEKAEDKAVALHKQLQAKDNAEEQRRQAEALENFWRKKKNYSKNTWLWFQPARGERGGEGPEMEELKDFKVQVKPTIPHSP